MWSLDIKKSVIQMRKKGFTYSEIRKKYKKLSKGTLAGWCKEVKFSQAQEERMMRKARVVLERARLVSSKTLHQRRLKRERDLQKEVKREFVKRQKDIFFLLGVVLYWAEGTKGGSTFQFMNSDPRLIKFMCKWLVKACLIPKEAIKIRLYTHSIFKHENYENYWKKLLPSLPVLNFKKTVYKSTPHSIKKNLNYKGCVRIHVDRVDLLRRIQYNCDLVARKYKLN